MLFSPLWPPALPLARRRMLPNGRATSSTTTSRSFGAAQNGRRSQGLSTCPLRFMNVSGFTSRVAAPFTVPLAVSASPSFRQAEKCHTSARWSRTIQPTLCRVLSYSRPGLPRPRMTFTVVSSAPGSFATSLDAWSSARTRARNAARARLQRELLGVFLALFVLLLANELGLGRGRALLGGGRLGLDRGARDLHQRDRRILVG